MNKKEKNINNVFGFWSPFDGVGKSTALINIAYELTKLDNTVCVVDLNLVCPDLFRYVKPDLGLNKQENSKSIKDKILNKSIPITEYIMKTKVNNLSLLTSVFLEHPSIYCESMLSESQQNNTIDTYISIFEELAVLFDYVIIDLDSNMLDISTISAFKSCDRIYTFLGHQIKSLEYLIKTTKVFDEIGMVDLFNNIIQGPIINEQWSENELRKYNKNINIIANFPFCQRVHAVGNNLEIFTAVDNSISKSAIEYKKSIKRIIAHIQEHRINENVQEIEYMQMIEGLEEIHIEELSHLPQIEAGRDLYKKLGKAPSKYRLSSEALIRRVLQGKGLYKVNNVVDINNLISLKSKFPAGSYNIKNIYSPISLSIGKEGEHYKGIGKALINISNLPVLTDSIGSFGSPTSDSERAMITDDVNEILLCIYSFSDRIDIEKYLEYGKHLLENPLIRRT